MSPHRILDNFVEYHTEHGKLCDLLEQIADTLPHHVEPEICESAIEMLRRDLPLHRRDHEEGLFPLLAERALPEDNVEACLHQLRSEHISDECCALEILEVLPVLASGDPVADPDTCGYMLRSFFECYRRHLTWELQLIVPLARRRLDPDDLKRLEALMLHHRL